MKEALKVGISGVRGVIGDSFTPQLAASFAQAFGTFVGHGSVVIGRDTRPSGQMIEYAVVAGLQSVGCKPILAGIVPTPTVLMLTKQLGARGGVVITASHNPASWNALKFVDRQGLFLDAIRADELFDIYHQQDFPLVPEANIPPAVANTQGIERHFARIRDYLDVAAIRRKRVKVAVDCCNGVGALYSPVFLRDMLGCDVVPLYDAPTGVFERDPEPLSEHLDVLRDAVRRHGCAVGFAQDPDGDRLAIVNEQADPIGEDLTLAFAVQQVLDHHERGPVAMNLATSRCVEDVARERGCDVIRTRVGEINVAEAMLKAGAVVGGENTGGVIVPRIHPCRDSFTAMGLMLERMAITGKSVSALRAEIPSYVVVKDKIRMRSEQATKALRSIRHTFAAQPMNLLDGLFIEFDQAWAHVRRSNTEPVLRITVEARTNDQAKDLAGRMRELAEKAVV